ncbi:hypothetical protein M0812_28611 [Anaeramoeba flamelloides]|uniref:Stealth protein CR2 conserved region 2 domain-containing protein n=1 Tax=Anaeramoeba flamelloides TaxID=1746091 RepID=A0AAV7YC78_9EUKA|nr:hypothetical protein M0812_28611 [Anaeramoeba flamelloides]
MNRKIKYQSLILMVALVFFFFFIFSKQKFPSNGDESIQNNLLVIDQNSVDKIENEINQREFELERKEFEIEEVEYEMAHKEEENEGKDLADDEEKKEYEKIKFELEQKKQQIWEERYEIRVLKKQITKERAALEMKKEVIKDEGKIDIVYSWSGIIRSMSIRNRYNYELQFSLRSVHKYLPWVNKIYILINSNTERPYWLKEDYPSKIRIIDRCALFENPDHCPNYNSFAIYSVAHKIPGLTNKFVLLDDDFFMNNPITPDHFFTTDGLPKIYHKRRRMPVYPEGDFPDEPFPKYKYARWSHVPKPMRRDYIIKFHEKYPTFAEHVQSHRRRYKFLNEEVSMIYYEFFYYKGWIKRLPLKQAKFKQLPRRHPDDIGDEFKKNYKILQSKKILTFNCNDNFSEDKELYQVQRKILWDFYIKLYPETPAYEIPNPDHEKYS